ncbi:cation:proton antiporter [Actinospica robiniae]|uniref:cation:proton antiporter n=1 Tax=Actinospica robiniae TaxID=304901 RepID=UPI000A0462C0|nr:cation:proton antiporter [Actinospica robiniae]
MASPNALPVEVVVLADVAVVLVVGALMARFSRWARQPAVVAEVVAGIMLGPSLLGLLPGHLPQHLFPPEAQTPLSVIANLGLAVFMFMAGWELDPRRLRGNGRALGLTAAMSMAVPFVVGGFAAVALYHSVGPHGVSEHVFILYMATAFSITAFPVLARIVQDRGLSRTRIGTLAMSCSAICDVAAWCVLALTTAMVGAGRPGGFLVTTGLAVGYAALMALVVRPILRRALSSPTRHDSGTLLVLITAGIFLSGLATTWIGVHAIFGAFAFGLAMPRRHVATAEVRQQIAIPLEKVSSLLLPVFFVVTGLSVNIGGLGWTGLVALLIAIVAAVGGKFAGAVIPARLSHLSWRESGILGTLMNTRGLTELVVLGIGRQLGLIGANLFTVMVLVAVVTTAMAGPLLNLLVDDTADAEDVLDAEEIPVPAAVLV